MILYRKFKDRNERNSSFASTGVWVIGGAKGYVGPPLKLLGGGPAPPSLPRPVNPNKSVLELRKRAH